MRSYSLNSAVEKVSSPPIAEAKAWVSSAISSAEYPLIDLAQAVPNYPPPDGLMDHLAAFVHQTESAFYTDILGLASLRECYAASLKREYNGQISGGNIAITPGCNNAYCLATMALAGPGDEIILPTPFYFNHDMWLTMTGITPRLLATRPTADGMLPDLDEAKSLIGPKTRAILLVTPNNPTGTEYPEEIIHDFADLAQQRGIALILDETYKDFREVETSSHRLFEDKNWPDHLIHLYSFSKAYSLAGYRVGAITAGEALIDAVGKIADTLNICTSHVGQAAALFGLQQLQTWRNDKRHDLLRLLHSLDNSFSEQTSAFKLASRGAFFAFLSHPFADKTSMEVAQQLVSQSNILCLPGSFFGPDQESYLRIAFANVDEAGLRNAVARLSRIDI